MTKTINSYIADTGEVEITLSAANVSAIAAFTTAGAILLDGAVVSFIRTNTPEVPIIEQKVIGDNEPIITTGKSIGSETWEMVLVDDYYSGAAGEWGTDDLAAVEIFKELFAARENPSALKCTPAGAGAANIEISLTDPKITGVSLPEIDANAGNVATVRVMISASGHTTAAHG